MSDNEKDPRKIQEQWLIGAMMNGLELVEVEEIINPTMLVSPLNQKIYQIIQDITDEEETPTSMTVASRLANVKTRVQPLEYTAACVHLHKKFQEFDARSIALAIREEFVSMMLETHGDAVKKGAQERTGNKALIATALQDLNEIIVMSGDNKKTMRHAAEESLKDTEEAYKLGKPDGVPWGFDALEIVADGPMQYGNIHGIMLDSSGGKTSISLQILRHAAEQNIPALFVSFEQEPKQCLQQMTAQREEIVAGKFRRGEINENEYGRMRDDHEKIIAMKHFEILEASRMTATDIGVAMMKFSRKYGRGLSVIDHAKSVLPAKGVQGISEQVNEIYTTLRDAARLSNMATIILQQRLRTALSRDNPAPSVLDAYGGGGSYEALDVMLGIYRPELGYKIKMDTAATEVIKLDFKTKMEAEAGDTWVYHLKNRYGEPKNRRKLVWIPQFTKFRDIERQQMTPDDELGTLV